MLIINLVERIIMPHLGYFFIVIGLFIFGSNSFLLPSQSEKWFSYNDCEFLYQHHKSNNNDYVISLLQKIQFVLSSTDGYTQLNGDLSLGDAIMLHQDAWGNNILHHACYASHKELVQTIINKVPGFINSQNHLGRSSLYYITDLPICLLYLQYKPDIHQKDCLSKSSLLWHIENNNIDIVAAILSYMKKNNISCLAEKPFAHIKSLEMAKVLSCFDISRSTINQNELISIDRASDQLSVGTQGTVEDFALDFNSENSLVDLRLKIKEAFWSSMNTQSNINITNIFKETLLHHAVRENLPELVKKLCNKGIDIYAQNCKGETALHLAVCYNNKDIVIFLLEYAAVISNSGSIVSLLEKKDSDGATALMLAVQENQFDMITLLIDRGSDIFTKNKYKHSLLHFVKDSFFAQYFISKGLHVNRVGIFGNTPLHCVANDQVAEVLIDNDADINALTDDGNTPLHTAKTTKIAKLLIAAHANLNYKNLKGQAPLHIAVMNNNVSRCELLINSGCDLNMKDNRHQTAFNLLKANKYEVPYADFVQESLNTLFHRKTVQPYAVRDLIEVAPIYMQFSMGDNALQDRNSQTQFEVDFIMQEQLNVTGAISNSLISVIP